MAHAVELQSLYNTVEDHTLNQTMMVPVANLPVQNFFSRFVQVHKICSVNSSNMYTWGHQLHVILPEKFNIKCN